jgi:hypothetical protein
LLEIRAGPRFAFSPGDINGLTVKPYVVATGAILADAPYMGGIGGGLTLHATAAMFRSTPMAKSSSRASAIPASIRWPPA